MSSFSFQPRPPAAPVVVEFGPGAVADAGPARTGVLVVDRAVHAAHLPRLDGLGRRFCRDLAPPIVIEASEAAKEVTRLGELWTALAARGLERASRAIVVGGGTVLDVGVFAAATYLRGLDLVVVPTTLLAQVDAGLGGKCGVNLGPAKNQIGLVRQPSRIVVDTGFLATLPEPEWRSGLGELLKTAWLDSEELLAAAEALPWPPSPAAVDPLVLRCLRKKAAIVERDPDERSERAVLNFGHTVGHVLESLALAAGTPVPHGICVAVGMVAEMRVLAGAEAAAERLAASLRRFGIPSVLGLGGSPDAIGALLARDKKRAGEEVTVPIVAAPGCVALERRPLAAVLAAVQVACRGTR